MLNIIDKKINTPELLVIKSAVRDLEPKNRRFMNVAIKLIEISRLLDYLKETMEQLNRINTETDDDSRRMAVMELVLPYLSQANRATLQTMMTFMEMANFQEANHGGAN